MKAVISVRTSDEDYAISDPLEEKPQTDAPKVVKDEDGGDDDEAKNTPPVEAKKDEPPQDEEEKNKFKPELFSWTISNGVPKTLAQIYHQIGCDHVITMKQSKI